MGNDGYTQVTQVGEEFNPGSEGNVAIAELLGFEAEVKDDGEAYIFDAENALGPKWVKCPDYCGDAATAAELMEFENRVPYIRPLVKAKGERKQRYTCIFDHQGGVYVTVPFMKGSYALACALHFILLTKVSHG